MAQPALSPQPGVLVLRNGNVLEGQITPAGDVYVVVQGDSELRPRAADVEFHCSSLVEAYEIKRRQLPRLGARPHLDLAEWCLRQRLYSKCAEQLIVAMRLEPDHPRLKLLEDRLNEAVRPPDTGRAAVAVSPPAVSAEQLEEAARALPAGSVERFGAVVQPILLHRCGANQCHGPNTSAAFRLLRPPVGQIPSRRFTQRNLYAVLGYLDRSQPHVSPLLVQAQRPHGAAAAPPFDKQSERQLAELIAWVRLASAAPSSSIPLTISHTDATLSQPAASGHSAAPVAGSTSDPPSGSSAAFSEPSPPPPPRAGEPFLPRDPYDPEVFNRRFHAAVAGAPPAQYDAERRGADVPTQSVGTSGRN